MHCLIHEKIENEEKLIQKNGKKVGISRCSFQFNFIDSNFLYLLHLRHFRLNLL